MAGGSAQHEPLGQWSLYWGVAVSAAAAPGLALLFAPVTTLSYRTELMSRWAALARVFAVSHRIFAVMIALALVGIVLSFLGLRVARTRAAAMDTGAGPGAPPPATLRRPSGAREPAFTVGNAGDAFFGLLLGLLNLLFWSTALYLSIQLHSVYRGWGAPLS